MVFVKVRETYDLHTTQNKMTVIGIHTPKPDIIKRNYPGLLMQCRAYRPYSCDVRVACASVMPLDPKGVGTTEGDVAPEDIFNPILYKAMSNLGMSQLEARINDLCSIGTAGLEVDGDSAAVEVDGVTAQADEFGLYYGLLSQTNSWKHANPQSGLSMSGLKPLVYEMLYNVGDNGVTSGSFSAPNKLDNEKTVTPVSIRGNAKPMPMINCTSYTFSDSAKTPTGYAQPGFPDIGSNAELRVPYIPIVVSAIIVPPSRLHTLFYRMVVEWTIEFSSIRPLSEITNFYDLAQIGSATHYQNYSYSKVKEAITGSEESILDRDTCMVSANVDVNKVM